MEIHWGGKMFKQTTGNKEERLAVHVGLPLKFFGTPKIPELFIIATSSAISGLNKSPRSQVFQRFKEEFYNPNQSIKELRVWDWPLD